MHHPKLVLGVIEVVDYGVLLRAGPRHGGQQQRGDAGVGVPLAVDGGGVVGAWTEGRGALRHAKVLFNPSARFLRKQKNNIRRATVLCQVLVLVKKNKKKRTRGPRAAARSGTCRCCLIQARAS